MQEEPSLQLEPQQLLSHLKNLEPKEIYGPWFFDIAPQQKERARASRFSSNPYTPQKTRLFEETLRNMFIAQNRSFKPIDRPCRLTVIESFKTPKSKQKLLKSDGYILKDTKPDATNLCKAVEDALDGYAYFNDSRIYDSRCIKIWSDKEFVSVELEVF